MSTQKPLKIKIYDHFIAFSLPFRTRHCSNGGSLAHGLRNSKTQTGEEKGEFKQARVEITRLNYDLPRDGYICTWKKKKNWLCLIVFLLFWVFGTEIASFDLLRISLPNFYGFATISNQISGNQFSRSINLVGWLILAYYGETWYTVRNYPRKFVTLFFSLSGPIKTI